MARKKSTTEPVTTSAEESYIDRGPASEQELLDLNGRVDEVMNLCNITSKAVYDDSLDAWGALQIAGRELNKIAGELGMLADRARKVERKAVQS
jgi:hypothetical protein